ncbi:MAG: hypothetical protein VX970_10125 [Planctomycetota bacterium]|nr:hypothetical protein [Planctomycetota bacterium]
MYRTASTYLVFLLTQTFTAFGDAPTIVESVRPTESFHHEIEVKLVGDQDFRTITIAGPRFWCRLPQATPNVNSKTSSSVIYNWYKIVDVGPTEAKSKPVYFLTPATILGREKADGSDKGNILIASVTSNTGQIGPERPANSHLILDPVVQRHHDDIFTIKEPRLQYLVKSTPSKSISGEINTIDQFGLHSAKRLSTSYQVVMTGGN